jgi:hypothetical protein
MVTNGIENAQVVPIPCLLKLHYTNDTYMSLLKQPNVSVVQNPQVLFSLKRNTTTSLVFQWKKASNVVKALKR